MAGTDPTDPGSFPIRAVPSLPGRGLALLVGLLLLGGIAALKRQEASA